MSAMERAIGEWKVQCALYLKFKKGELSFTLHDLFNESALANLDPAIALVIVQNAISGQMFTITPPLQDDSNVNDEFTLNFNPLMEQVLIDRLDRVLKDIQKTYNGPVDEVVKKLQSVIDAAIQEKDPVRKVERVFAILVENSMARG